MSNLYKSGDFCKHIGCYNLDDCNYCKAYMFHQYLRERGQILEEASKSHRRFDIRKSLQAGRPIDAKSY